MHGPAHVLGFPRMRDVLCPTLDQGLSALMQDDVVIIVWDEFGRLPRINKDAGRDHWLPAMSAVIAGGGPGRHVLRQVSGRRGYNARLSGLCGGSASGFVFPRGVLQKGTCFGRGGGPAAFRGREQGMKGTSLQKPRRACG
jgi:hypothetical protein